MPGGLGDLMARSQAAGGMMGAGGPDMGAPAPDAPPDDTASQGGADDVETGAAMIEAFADSLDPETGDQIREHLNAIRELASNAPPSGEPPPPDEGSPMPGGEPQMPPEPMPTP